MNDAVQSPIGFVGLGIMGEPMARNLLGAGLQVVVHSRSRAPVDRMVALGADGVDTPAAVAQRASILITMLPDSPDLLDVCNGPDGLVAAMTSGSLLIDMSTVSPETARQVGLRLASIGASMIDAPVSGGQRGAVDGTLSIMVGGDERDVERSRELFSILGRNVVHVGPLGAGQVAKACNQLVVASTIQAVAEALVLARGCGVDPARVRSALAGGFADSRILEIHGARMLEDSFEPGFRHRLHAKDAAIISVAARTAGIRLPAFDVVHDAMKTLLAAGHGDLDHAVLVKGLTTAPVQPAET